MNFIFIGGFRVGLFNHPNTFSASIFQYAIFFNRILSDVLASSLLMFTYTISKEVIYT
jgi:hypothetical protein